jgi:NADH dehydrogenase
LCSTFPKRTFVVEGLLSNPESLRAAVVDCRKVVHLSERVFGRSAAEFRLENVEGTRSLIQACKEAKVGHFIFLSSAAVDFRNSTLYGRSKKIAEDVLRGSGLVWTILRPTLLVGASGGSEYHWLRHAVRRFRFLPLPDGGHVVKSPVHEEDLAAGIGGLLRANVHTVARRTYHLTGRQALTLAELVDMIAAEHHLLPRRILRVPSWLCSALARFADRIMPPKLPFAFFELYRALVQDSDFDTERAIQDFGFDPKPLLGRLHKQSLPNPVEPPTKPLQRGLRPRTQRTSLLRR